MRILIGTIIIFVFIVAGCKKDKTFTKDHLDFSVDTVLFDTVFTTVGSTTKRFKIYNRNSAKILIEEIELMGGASSPFRINIDGVSGVFHEDIELGRKDSLFAFVEVTLQVNNATNPLIISDSIRFLTNGLNQYVKLDVWGQDAYFHANEVTAGVWPNDKPHVLYGIVAVGYPGIDSNLNLTIQQGTNVYCHKGAKLIVYKSSIDIQGQLNNEVTFQGDRLESFYDDVSGQWDGIFLSKANYSTINYAVIKNSAYGLQVDSTNSINTLLLRNTIINNTDFFNFIVARGGNVEVENCLFGSAGLISTYLFAGGTSKFTNCNFVNYWSGSRGGPAFAIKNWWKDNGTIYQRDVTCDIYNSVFYGTAENEFVIDSLYNGTALFDMEALNCLIKRDVDIYNYSYLQNIIWNQNPLFVASADDDFHFEAGSPLDNAGNPSYATSLDIEGTARNMGAPDIGCYEKP